MVTRRPAVFAILSAAAITINACVQIASSGRSVDTHAMIFKPLVIRGGAAAEYVKAIAASAERSPSPPRISPFGAIPIKDIGLYSNKYRSDEYHR